MAHPCNKMEEPPNTGEVLLVSEEMLFMQIELVVSVQQLQ